MNGKEFIEMQKRPCVTTVLLVSQQIVNTVSSRL